MIGTSLYKSYFLLKANYLPTVKRNCIDLTVIYVFYIIMLLLTFAFFDLAKYRMDYDAMKAVDEPIKNLRPMFRMFTAISVILTVNFVLVLADTIILSKTLYNVKQKRGISEEIRTSDTLQKNS